MLKELYKYRELLKNNVKKEIRGKYKGSFFGILWSFFNPLLSALVYAIVFPFILKNTQDNYLIFLVIGIIPWQVFVTTVLQGTTCILINAGIINKVYFPREILPISVVISGIVNYLISFLVILLFVIFGGIGRSWHIIFLPLIIIVQAIFSLGVVFITSSINVYVRDVEYLINFVLNMLFYATPIIYKSDLFPEKFRFILDLNPMSLIVTCYRDILLYHSYPHFKSLGLLFVLSLLLVLIGHMVFKKLSRGFAEEL